MSLSPRLRTLPWELVELILMTAAKQWYIAEPGALARLCRLSRIMHDLSTPLLYSIVILHGADSAQRFSRTLASRPVGFLARHLKAMSVSLREGDSWAQAESTLAPFAPILGIVSHAQAPLDLFDKVLETYAWQRSDAAFRDLRVSLLPPSLHTPVDSTRVLRRLVSDARVTHIHIGGLGELFGDLITVACGVQIGGEKVRLTHITCDAHMAKMWTTTATIRAIRDLFYLAGIERLVFRVCREDDNAQQLLQLLEVSMDHRICIHYVPKVELQSMTQTAVDGWRMHMAGIDNLWLSGEPVYVPVKPV
ncbi:hypothetical protein BKA62DRAFT_694255 [Auriculariales sp. MPI-PUGE-AT-0066]|nr:hypothetical protein BKA62DRAFT_694255 [Auriculariales sp. MPI-PUGE-AT-0066]